MGIHLISRSGLLGQQYVVCFTCMRKHRTRTDRINDEMREWNEKHRGHSIAMRGEWWAFLHGGRYQDNANVKQAFGGDTAITLSLAPGGTGLASSATVGRESTAVDNASNLYLDALVRLHIKLASGTPANDQAVYVYAYGSEDGTNYTDNATGSDASITLRGPTNLRLVGTIAMPTAGALTYKSHPINIAPAFGGILPVKWGIAVINFTGVACDGTEGNHAKGYNGVYLTT